MDRATRRELKKLLVLVLIISAAQVVLQISVLNNTRYERYSSILPYITKQLRQQGKGRSINNLLRHRPTISASDVDLVPTLTNLSEESNRTLDSMLLLNKSITFKDWLHLMEVRQMMRTDRIKLVCARLNSSKYTADEMLVRKGLRATFYSNDRYQATVSVVKKAASNNLENLFKDLGGFLRLFLLPEDICKPKLDSYLTILFVRHPLSRVLSAYIDKFVLHHIEHFLGIGKIIISSQRTNVSRKERYEAARKGVDVKFEEFLSYIVSSPERRKNSHWNNYWKHNRVCEMQYKFIGKLETMRDDVKYMLHKLKVDNLTQMDIPRAYMSYHGDLVKLRSYYKNISKGLLRQLYSAYKTDFELFGYDMDLLGFDIWS